MAIYRINMLFFVGIFSIILGFYSLYLEYAQQQWLATDAQVLSIAILEKGRHGPQEDHYRLTVSYNVRAQDVRATMDNYGQPNFRVRDTIPVKIDPGNPEHFVFNQGDAGISIAVMFILGITISSASFLILRARTRQN